MDAKLFIFGVRTFIVEFRGIEGQSTIFYQAEGGAVFRFFARF